MIDSLKEYFHFICVTASYAPQLFPLFCKKMGNLREVLAKWFTPPFLDKKNCPYTYNSFDNSVPEITLKMAGANFAAVNITLSLRFDSMQNFS